jgi:antitoxin component YwqK of YwqJK toxin-antitoxin module
MRSSIILGSITLLALTTACNRSNRYYDDGQQVVTQSYVHKYGVEIDPVGWNERGGHGHVVSTQKNGVTVDQNYVEGVLDGETTYTFPHSSTKEKVVVYDKGNLMTETVLYPTGQKKMVTEYNPSRPDYLIISQWYENGTQRSRETFTSDRLDEGTYYDYKGEVESTVAQGSGNRFERDDLGNLISSDRFEDGDLIETTFYHPNRMTKEVIPYVNGTIQGMRKFYLVGGEPDRFEEWQNGRQTGVTIVFQHGEKVAEVPYVNGWKQGIERRFRDGQYVVEEVSWVNGMRSGSHTVYINDQATVDWFYNDKPVSKNMYDKLSNPQMR